MTITRKSLADEIDVYDQQIADMNAGKKDCFDAYRAQLADGGMDKANIKTEIEAVKAAIKRRRAVAKDAGAVEEKDALTEEVYEEITARAPRVTRVASDGPEQNTAPLSSTVAADRVGAGKNPYPASTQVGAPIDETSTPEGQGGYQTAGDGLGDAWEAAGDKGAATSSPARAPSMEGAAA